MKKPKKKSTTIKKIIVPEKPKEIETSGDSEFDSAIDLFLKKKN